MKTGITGTDADSARGRTSPPPAQDAERGSLQCPCGAYHRGMHEIDGVMGYSPLCRRHTSDQFRSQWAMMPESEDPRIEAARFKPHNVRRASSICTSVVLGIVARTDLLNPPGEVEPICTGDNRVDWMPLSEAIQATDTVLIDRVLSDG